jgi:glycosyltransferase involved in cell wall biosynthesis
VKYKDLGCRFFTLSRYSFPAKLYYYYSLKRRFRKSLSQCVDFFKPDVVVLASDWQMLTGEVIEAAKSAPVVAEFHNAYDYVMRKVGVSGNKLKIGLIQFYYKFTIRNLKRCAQLVVLTEADARLWRLHFDHVSVIPNPVTCYPDTIDDVPKDSGRILFVGRFNHEKRIDRLIKAFSIIANKHIDWHVDIFGDGNEKQYLLNLISELKLGGRIVIHEPTKAIYDEYKRSEMLVLCSEHEASPLVLIEAMACGVPCVSMDCPNGPREIIKDGETGLLARDGDVEDLALKMEWLIIHQPERKLMGQKARAAAATRQLSVIMEDWEELYSNVRYES